MLTPAITIIGAGNMGASLLGGLINQGYSANSLTITDLDPLRLQSLHECYKVNISTKNSDTVKKSDVIILAIKPDVLPTVCEELASALNGNAPLIISIAAGIPLSCIEKHFSEKMPMIRAMPNTPALINAGATGLYANPWVNDEQKSLAEDMLSAVGLVVWIKQEAKMDVVTALSGSGPAYFFYIMELMQQAAEKLGLPTEIAKQLTLHTAYGASRMALESECDVQTLRKKVTSPGGTTEKAISVLEKKQLNHIIFSALEAAKERGRELATEAENR